MSTRVLIICVLAIAAIVASALALSHQLMEQALSTPVQYTERSRCEYSPAEPALAEFSESERVPYAHCDLMTCIEIEATLTRSARRLHDPLSVEDC